VSGNGVVVVVAAAAATAGGSMYATRISFSVRNRIFFCSVRFFLLSFANTRRFFFFFFPG
jgi:hypothetical protein